MIEICCGSYEDAYHAYKGGAKRVELNSALHLGGLTPSVASLDLVKQNTDLEVICMVRVRGAGFCYNEMEVEQMFAEAKDLLKHNADGLAFGFLNADSSLDIDNIKKMVTLIHSYHKIAVFHRAFDCIDDYHQTIKTLISLDVDRVLTSGLEDKAMLGKDILKDLQQTYGDQIEILPGSGINTSNAKELMEYTGINQIHSSCRDYKLDPTTSTNKVSYSYSDQKDHYDYVSEELVRKLVEGIKEDR